MTFKLTMARRCLLATFVVAAALVVSLLFSGCTARTSRYERDKVCYEHDQQSLLGLKYYDDESPSWEVKDCG